MANNFWAEALEQSARAIAAAKRDCRPTHPTIDRVWPSYVGQAKACVLAFLEDSANGRKAKAITDAVAAAIRNRIEESRDAN